LLKPQAAGLTHLLWRVHHGRLDFPPAPAPGLVSVETEQALPFDYYAAAGFRVYGPRAVRIDMAERVAFELRKLARQGPFPLPENLMSLIGSPREEFTAIIKAFGYRIDNSGEEAKFVRKTRRKPRRKDKDAPPQTQAAAPDRPAKPKKPRAKQRPKKREQINEDSPFAVLKEFTAK
jgi:ATP-dependent RNA helicase SUPV3L1/SUV3